MAFPLARTRRPRVLAGLLVASLLAATTLPSGADLIEDDVLNFSLETPRGWVRLPESPGWKDLGIVVGAVRELRELKDGAQPDGEGALVNLAISKVPEGKSLEDLAQDPHVQGFLMNRFGEDPATWPPRELIPDTYEGGLEIRILRTTGKAPNLKGKERPARGVMLLTIAKGKLYQLRMYAWPTEFDAEGLKDDLDLIEMNFYVPDTTPEEKPAEKPPPPPEEVAPEDVPEGDEAEEKVVEGVAGVELETAQEAYRFVKPKGLKSKEDFDKTQYDDVVAWFEDNDNVGSYQIMFYMIPKGRKNKETGQNTPDIVLEEWVLDGWWESFCKDHPDGPIWTYEWPRRSEFLALPDWEDERVVASEPGKRPMEADASDLIKKLRVAERMKNAKVGRDKPQRAYRCVLSGNRARVGREVVVQYIWETPRVSCRVYVGFGRDARMKWSDEIDAFLASIEMLGRPR